MTCPFHLEPGQAGRVPGRSGVVDDISHEGLRVLLREEGRHLLAVFELGEDKLFGHIKPCNAYDERLRHIVGWANVA